MASLFDGALLIVPVLLSMTACSTTRSAIEAQGSGMSNLACADDDATNLASIASKMDGESSQGRCYHYVKEHLRDAGYDISPVDDQVGAYEFGEWGDANPDQLQAMGFQKITPSLDEIPKGSILVWAQGQCGYSAEYGHIEIVIDDDSSRACSDFCGHIKKDCGSPDIFAPVGCVSGPGSPPGALDDDPAAGIDDSAADDATACGSAPNKWSCRAGAT
jgi:hypothetical protein